MDPFEPQAVLTGLTEAGPPDKRSFSAAATRISSGRRAASGQYWKRRLDYETDIDGIPEAYQAMNDRRAIKALIRVGTP